MKYLIAGLGNIGEEYANTRHNIGFMVVDELAQSLGATFKTDRYAAVSIAKFRGRTLVIIKPSTYMNLSGKAVRYWLEAEKIQLENLLVISDDLDIGLGMLRLKRSGSGGSHNGLNHIVDVLGTIDFPRLRFGIGNDFTRGSQVDFVLSSWTKEEESVLQPRISAAAEVIKSFVAIGIDRTMNLYNNR